MNLSPLPIQKFFSNDGVPLASGKLFAYLAGTTTKTNTFTDAGGLSPNTNPIILDFRGECRLWIDPLLSYKFVLAPATDTDPPGNPIWTVDNITASPATIENAAIDTGSGNSIQLNIPGLSSTPVIFTRIVWKSAIQNTGAVTITINGGLSKALQWQNVADLSPSSVIVGGLYEAIYDGSVWQLQGPTLTPDQLRTSAEVAAGVSPTNYVYPELNILRYGNNTSPGSTDMQPALTRAISVALQKAAGAEIIIPDGTYFMGDTVACTLNRMNLRGAGVHATTLTFNPSSAKPLLKLQAANPANILAQPSISGMTLQGFGTNQKIGIDAWDTSELHISDVTITGFTGATSTGLRTQGREFTRLDRMTISADQPIHIVRNPNSPTLSADHFDFREIYCLPQVATGSSILIDGDVGMATFNVDGIACVGGKWGINFLSGTVPSTALGIKISNLRFEQPADNTGFAVEWNAPTIDLLLENCNYGGVGSPTNGGLKCRNVSKITQLNCLYTGASTALDINGTCDDYWQQNTLQQGGSSVVMTGFEEVFSLNLVDATAPLRPTTYWYRTASGRKSLRFNGVNTDYLAGTIASGATVDLPMMTSGAVRAAEVILTGYNAAGPQNEMGVFLVTASAAVLLAGTANVAIGNTAAKLCIHFSSQSSIVIRNNLANVIDFTCRSVWKT